MSSYLFDDPMWDTSRWLDEPFFRPGADYPLSRSRGGPGEWLDMNQAARRGGSGGMRTWQPRVDIHENAHENQVVAMVELPGLKRDDIHVDVQNNRVVVTGECTPKDIDEKGFVHRERPCGKFNRILALPSGVKPSDVHAKYENGLLYIKYPKSHKGSIHRLTID